MTHGIVAAIAALLVAGAAGASGPDDDVIVVIKAGKVITVTGEEIERGDIVIVDGVIELVGVGLAYPAAATVIEARDMTVMPGLVHAWTRLGMPRISSNGVAGDRSVLDEIYLDEMDWEPLLEAGFVAACLYPDGSGIAGTTSVIRLAGDPEKQVLRDAAHLVVPMTNPGRDKGAFRAAMAKAKAELEKIKKAREEFEKKQKEAEAKKAEAEKEKEEGGGGDKPEGEESPRPGGAPQPGEKPEQKKEEEKPAQFEPPKTDPAYQPLMDLIEKKEGAVPAMCAVSSASGVLHLEDVLPKDDDAIPTMLFLSPRFGGDFDNVVPRLGEKGGLLMTYARMHSIPSTVIEYNLVAELYAAGCEVALLPSGDGRRDLMNYLGSLANLERSGLRRDEALRSVTLNAAKMARVDDRLGSIEKGKSADLIFLDGDPLDPLAQVRRVMILGETVWEKEDAP